MRLTVQQMRDRMLARDAGYNGRFFFGVSTTGIYCLPSCAARRAKPENVRFFPDAEAARGAGLRACRKCRPDDFARGANPVLEAIEALVAEVRARPADFPDVRALVRRSGFGATRVFELFRLHYQATPAEMLARARLKVAKTLLLETRSGLSAVASAAGFESLSVLHEHFRRRTGLTPAGYRKLAGARAFDIELPPGYPLGYLLRALGRDPGSLTERLDGNVYSAAVQLESGPAVLTLRLSPRKARAEVSAGSTALAIAAQAHAVVIGLLGLDQDAAGFSRLARKLGLARLVGGRPELRLSQTPSVFDGLIWAIIGQQINVSFAFALKRALVERAGIPLAGGLYAPPTPEALAALSPDDLRALRFSRQKADYVLSAARLVARGELDLGSLRGMSATRAERTLLALRGLGPWSVNYVMMRALGFADCVPYGDTGVTSGLQSLLKLEERPDVDATRRLMSVFSPYRSLAVAHLWQFNLELPHENPV